MRLTSPLLCALLLLTTVVVQAQTQRYITDELELPMRTGASTQFRILRMLTSGTPVTLVDSDPASGYSRVRTTDGTLGFVPTRYLSDTPGLQQRLDAAEADLESLRTGSEQLNERLAAFNELEQQARALQEDNQRLSRELAHIRDVSANAIALDERNQTLEEQVIGLERSLQLARQENEVLRDRSNQDWFMRGAGVLLAGLLTGLILPRLRSRRSSRWGEL